MNESNPRAYLEDCDTFLLGGALVLLITYHEIDGMVGETEYWAEARVFNSLSGEISKHLTWGETKDAYKRVNGKKERIHLWSIMKHWLSPEGREAIADSITADAISRVI